MTTGNWNRLLGVKLHVNRIDTVIESHEIILKNSRKKKLYKHTTHTQTSECACTHTKYNNTLMMLQIFSGVSCPNKVLYYV